MRDSSTRGATVGRVLRWGLLVGMLAIGVWSGTWESGAQTAPTMRPMVGTQANLWSAAAVGVNGTSTSFDTRGFQMCMLFGNSTATATTITVQVSSDNSSFYGTEAATTTGATGDFGIYLGIGARYIRLLAAAAGTVTATAQCKS